jgi:hypothetical protein
MLLANTDKTGNNRNNPSMRSAKIDESEITARRSGAFRGLLIVDIAERNSGLIGLDEAVRRIGTAWTNRCVQARFATASDGGV